jgi:cleavage and polyadenylation specificity factor subunit 1
MSWNAYAVWRERQKATAVEHCVSATAFTSLNSHDPNGAIGDDELVTAGPGVLRVYDVRAHDASLRLLFELPLFGEPMSVASIRVPSASVADSSLSSLILVTFAPAKLSVLEYSKAVGDFRTIGVLSFDSVPKSFENEVFTPQVAVDPNNRCCAMVVSCTAISIVPSTVFRQSSFSRPNVDANVDVDPGQHASIGWFVQDLTFFKIKRIRDIAFLHGYHEPTILLLHEPFHTWEGRAAVRRNSCQLVAFSLDLTRKSVSMICSSELLPLNTYRILPVPSPLGGAVVLSMNRIFYFTQSLDSVLSVNDFGDKNQSDFRVPTRKLVIFLHMTMLTFCCDRTFGASSRAE